MEISIDVANSLATATIAGTILKIAPTQNQIIAAGNGPVSIEVAATSTDGLPAMLTRDSLPTYATFTDNGNGTATVTFNPSTSDIGSDTVSFTATDSNTSLSSSFDVEVVAVESVESNEPAIRINAVGGAVGGFSADQFANTGRPFGAGAVIGISDPSVSEDTPAAILQTTIGRHEEYASFHEIVGRLTSRSRFAGRRMAGSCSHNTAPFLVSWKLMHSEEFSGKR